jgi:outer membrane PBP1 activator LpoA protein
VIAARCIEVAQGACDASQVEPTRYRIVVRGELSDRFSAAFEGMELQPTGGETVITGEIRDQSQLRGLLDRAAALGLELVSVEPLEPRAPTL